MLSTLVYKLNLKLALVYKLKLETKLSLVTSISYCIPIPDLKLRGKLFECNGFAFRKK